MCVWGESANEKETKGNSPEDGQFQFRIPLNGEREKGKEWKDAKSPVVNFTIRNSVTILVKSSDFWQLHKYLQTITQQKRRKKKEEKKSGWITIDDGQSRMDNGDELCSS